MTGLKQKAAGYVDDGRRYVVRDLNFVDQGSTHLINDVMEFQIDLRGKCAARFNQPNGTTYAQTLRAFYLRDDETGKLWSVPFDPVQMEPQKFEFSAGITDVQWRVQVDDIEAHVRVTVPRNDPVELWTVTINNRGDGPRNISLFPYFPIGLLTWITQIARYDARLCGIVVEHFPYYVKVPDYYKLRERKNWIFCVADRKAESFEANMREFLGGRGVHNPAAFDRPKLGNNEARMENTIICMQYPMSLAPGAASTVNLMLGPAKDRDEIARLSKIYLKHGGINRAISEVQAHLDTMKPQVRVETPDPDFDHFVNNWLPQQAHFCGGLMRLSGDPCVRNAYQDAMGITFTNPRKARYWYTTVLAHQHRDGFMPHGAPLAEGVDRALINTIPHKDMNVWAPLAISYYMTETGDLSILKDKVGFKDSTDKMSVYDHVCLGLDWQLKDRTKRKLCRIGEGDWDDPLNMAGMNEKGESIWLTEALAIALDVWAEVAEHIGDKKRGSSYRKEADVCREVVNKLAWDGKWYARGTTDAGKWFGTKKDTEGKIFLNAQSWAMICGATDSPKRIKDCIDSVNKHLMTPSGPMTMSPAFTSMREDIGKITQKCPGTSENGSVYCHAASFYAYGLYRVRQADEAFKVLRMLLTGGESNPLSRTQQLPLFIPNFYRGASCGKTAGRGSNLWGTGTVAWYYRTVVGELLGVRGEFDGLRIDPQLPKEWDKASLTRTFRGGEYRINITRSAKVKKTQVTVDGRQLDGNLIPLLNGDDVHEVEVLVPMKGK